MLKGLDECPLVESGILIRRRPVEGLAKFRQLCPPEALRFSAALSHLYALLITLSLCVRFRPDVCIAISLLPHGVLAKLGQVLCRAHFVNWLIGTDMYVHLAGTWWGKLLRGPISGASCTMCMGSVSKRRLEAMGWKPGQVIVGMSAYDFSDYREPSAHKRWDVTYTGRLNRKQKRVGLLLRAVERISTSRPSVRCAIVGDGPDRRRLERMRDALGLQKNVEFLGHRSDIPNLLSMSRILLMTSAWEGLPASIVEALVSGLPVVAPKVGDIGDVIADGRNGVLVDSDRPVDYAKAVLQLLDAPDLYRHMSACAKRTGRRIQEEVEAGAPLARWELALRRTGLWG